MKLKLITTTYTFLCFLLTYSHINHNLADLLTSLGYCSQPVVRFKIESLKTPMLSWQNRIGNNFSHTYGQYFGQQAAYLFPVYNFISFLFYTSFQCFLLDFFFERTSLFIPSSRVGRICQNIIRCISAAATPTILSPSKKGEGIISKSKKNKKNTYPEAVAVGLASNCFVVD